LRLSASQVQTYEDCPRKWSWQYVAKIVAPPNAAAELGGRVHSELEKYLNGGEIDFTTEAGYIAASGLEHLPKPGTVGMLVEEEFHFWGPSERHSYLGYKDVEVPGIVFDHKTTSDLRWQKTVDDLRADIQATLYAADYFRRHSDETEVELRWVYYQTKNARKSAVTVLRVHRTDVWNRFLHIEQIANEMEEAATKQPLELPPNINHCSAYGGCPHQGRCNLSPFEKMRSHVTQNKLLQSLAAKKNGVTAPAVPAPPMEAVASAPPAPNKLLARLQVGGAPVAAAVNPPEFQAPPPPPAPAPAAAPAAAETAPAAAAAAAEPRGRGRPKKAALPPTGLVVKIETLYINCGPVGIAVADATHFIALAKKRVLAEGLADYRFAEYGQGPGLLAVAAAAELDAVEGTFVALRLDTNTPEGQIVAVEFMARAGLVVR
jgi:PD-(D/E)XK nuclease superfamily